jgi:hypothetical protein
MRPLSQAASGLRQAAVVLQVFGSRDLPGSDQGRSLGVGISGVIVAKNRRATTKGLRRQHLGRWPGMRAATETAITTDPLALSQRQSLVGPRIAPNGSLQENCVAF